jgi:hypothetical protein
MRKKRYLVAFVIWMITLILFPGCKPAPAPTPSILKPTGTWTNQLNATHSLIITGSSDQAIEEWFYLRNNLDLTPGGIEPWIALQMDILTNKLNDPSKYYVRLQALAELGNFPEFSTNYVPWLQQCLATNFFTDQEEVEEAQRVLRYLQSTNP